MADNEQPRQSHAFFWKTAAAVLALCCVGGLCGAYMDQVGREHVLAQRFRSAQTTEAVQSRVVDDLQDTFSGAMVFGIEVHTPFDQRLTDQLADMRIDLADMASAIANGSIARPKVENAIRRYAIQGPSHRATAEAVERALDRETSAREEGARLAADKAAVVDGANGTLAVK